MFEKVCAMLADQLGIPAESIKPVIQHGYSELRIAEMFRDKFAQTRTGLF